jgi:hypothetical protein
MQKFSPGESIRQFCHWLSMANFLSREYFVLYYSYIESMVTFTALVNDFFYRIFPKYKHSWAWCNLYPAKISRVLSVYGM